MTTPRQRRNAPYKLNDRVCHRQNTDCRGTITSCEFVSSGRIASWYVTVRIDGEDHDTRQQDAWTWRDLAEVEAYEALSLEERFRTEVARHDWYYAMSDDYSVWSAGERHIAQMREMAAGLPSDIVAKIWSEHAPDGMSPPKGI